MTAAHGYPLRVPVQVHRWSTTVKDELNNYVPGYAEPEDWLVVGVEPQVSGEVEMAGHDRTVVDAKMYAPSEIATKPRDRITYKDHVFEVIGYPQDAGDGPFWDLPLSTILLRRIEAT